MAKGRPMYYSAQHVKKPLPTAMSMKHTLEGHQGTIWSFVFLQDNVHIVSGSEDGTMRKWDCETGQLIGEPWKAKRGIFALALSPDGKTIVCGGIDGSVQRWDTNGQMRKHIWIGHRDRVLSLSWSPSGGHLASGSGDGTILVRKVESGAVEVGPIKTNQGKVRSVAYCDRLTVAGGASDEFAHVFDSASGTLPSHYHPNTIHWHVGLGGTAHLWGTVSHQPFHVPFANKTTILSRWVVPRIWWS